MHAIYVVSAPKHQMHLYKEYILEINNFVKCFNMHISPQLAAAWMMP